MRKYNLGRNLTAMLMMWTLFVMPFAAFGQTRIQMPKNKYKVQDDVKIGQQAASQVERQMPILNDAEAARYVAQVGERLVRAIPSQFRQPAFDYRFKVVNARDINAFALPGGYMYVNRGMIEAAKSEGEMAGVMAHEISHVALRHGTAGATKSQNPVAQLPAIGGAILGAIFGGVVGGIAQTAGYDPRDLANMFRTIEQQSSGSRGPEFLSSHPNPSNRYENINREAQLLRINNPVRNTAQFERVQSNLRRLPRAQSMSEIEKNGQTNNGQNPTSGGRYSSRIPYPSSRTQTYTAGNVIQLNIPNNWRTFESEQSVQFAPEGAYGNQGITHGALIGVVQGRSNNLGQSTEDYVGGVLQSNNYLRQNGSYSRTSISGRTAYATVLSGRSPINGKTEVVNVYTTQLRNGNLLYVTMVAPENESSRYNTAFRNMLRSIRLND